MDPATAAAAATTTTALVAAAITALLATTLTLLAQALALLVRLCCHKLVAHTLVKYYLKKSLRVVNTHVQRTRAWRWWIGWCRGCWARLCACADACCGGGTGGRVMQVELELDGRGEREREKGEVVDCALPQLQLRHRPVQDHGSSFPGVVPRPSGGSSSSPSEAWVPIQRERQPAERDGEHGEQGKLASVTALAAALDSVRHVVVGAEPPVTMAAARRPSIDEVVAGGLGGDYEGV